MFQCLQDRQMRELPWCHRQRLEESNGRSRQHEARPKSACPEHVQRRSWTNQTNPRTEQHVSHDMNIVYSRTCTTNSTPISARLALLCSLQVLLLGQNQGTEARVQRCLHLRFSVVRHTAGGLISKFWNPTSLSISKLFPRIYGHQSSCKFCRHVPTLGFTKRSFLAAWGITAPKAALLPSLDFGMMALERRRSAPSHSSYCLSCEATHSPVILHGGIHPHEP